MELAERLGIEAAERGDQLIARFPLARCIFCNAAGHDLLRPVAFHWRKQVGRSPRHHVRVEHVSEHLLCKLCLNELCVRRRWFWLLRYIGGITLAMGLCGLFAEPMLLYFMKLAPAERRAFIPIGVVAAVLLLLAVAMLLLARRYSVPPRLLEFTGRGWECVAVNLVGSGGEVSGAN